MANEQNLIPSTEGGYKLTRADKVKGGKESGKKRRKARQMREIVNALLAKSVQGGKLEDLDDLESLELAKKANLTADEAIAVALTAKAVSGDLKATEYLLKLIGQDPTEGTDEAEAGQVIIYGEGEILE